MRLHHDIGLVIVGVEVLLEVIGEVLLTHLLLEFLIVAMCILVNGVGLASKLKTTHLRIVLGQVITTARIS